jgi:hypothetical protein
VGDESIRIEGGGLRVESGRLIDERRESFSCLNLNVQLEAQFRRSDAKSLND